MTLTNHQIIQCLSPAVFISKSSRVKSTRLNFFCRKLTFRERQASSSFFSLFVQCSLFLSFVSHRILLYFSLSFLKQIFRLRGCEIPCTLALLAFYFLPELTFIFNESFLMWIFFLLTLLSLKIHENNYKNFNCSVLPMNDLFHFNSIKDLLGFIFFYFQYIIPKPSSVEQLPIIITIEILPMNSLFDNYKPNSA